MDLGLSDRAALVTAASRGLGRACAQALAEEGARVFVSSRDRAAIEATAAEIGAAGSAPADMADPEAIARLVESATAALGGLDVLVVNAGGPPPGTFASVGEDGWQRGFDLTLMSAVRLIRAALPHLQRSDQGRIVVITSVSVRQPVPNLLLSNAYRSAVTSTAKTLSREVARFGVTVNCLAPDAILTDRIRSLRQPAASERGLSLDALLEQEARSHPMGRFGEPIEFGRTCAFLCSRHAGYITGQTIGVDGGTVRGVF